MEEYAVAATEEKAVIRKVVNVNKDSEYFLPDEEIEKLLSASKNLRDRCLIGLMAFGGLRRDEARSLQIEDIDFERGWLNLKETKFHKTRTVPIVKRLQDDLRLLIGNRETGIIFISNKGGRLSLKQVNNIIAAAGERANLTNPNPRLKTINCHILRHSFARRFLRSGGRIDVLQRLLGHSTISTTVNVYGSPSLDDIQKQYRDVYGS